MPDPILSATGDALLLRLTVVPGAARDGVVGRHGDRLKLRVRAAPERGRANREVCRLLAARLGVRTRDVTIVAGTTHPHKTARVQGVALRRAEEALLS